MWTHAELSALAARHGDHFYLAFPDRFATNLTRFRAAFAARWPRSTASYSVKTNYLPAFLRAARDAGCGAEVVSRFEYELALRLGFPPERVVLNGPVKSPALLASACAGGAVVHLDSAYEIDALERPTGSSDPGRWRIGLRCNLALPDAPSRFGFDVASGELEAAARRLRAVGVRVCGLHAHVATQPKTLAAFVARLRGLLDAAGRVFTDRPPDHIDAGGGFYPPGAPAGGPTFDAYAHAAADELTRHYGTGGPELILEPGVAVALDVMSYVCRVLDVKAIGGRRVAITTGSVHTVRPTGYERHSTIAVVSGGSRPGGERVALGGYTCMEHDLLAVDFPGPVAAGDFVTVSNVGAYATVLKPPFIDLAPPILVPAGDGWELARRAETVEDVLALHPSG